MPTIKKKGNNRPWQPERKPFGGREVDNTKFYQSQQWRRLRSSYIIEHPLCVECKKKGIITQAQVVDHIIPIAKGGDRFAYDNLQSLCSSCHNKKSAKEKS